MRFRISPIYVLQRLWRSIGSLWDRTSPRGFLSPLNNPDYSQLTLPSSVKSGRPLTSVRPRWDPRRHSYKSVLIFCFLITLVYVHRTVNLSGIRRATNDSPRLESKWHPLRRDSDWRYPSGDEFPQTLYDGLPYRAVKDLSHRHSDDGTFLEVDMSAPANHGHPIFQLIKNAREEWHRKVERQSKTLRQAVEEYRRRYDNMEPPAGFDKWWKFVKENDVQLPDEYDQIYRDLYIYRAIRARDLRKALDKAEASPDVHTLQVQDGVISTIRTFDAGKIGGGLLRQEGQVKLMRDFGIDSWLPDLKAVFGVHDTPTGFISWEQRREMMNLVEAGEYVDDYYSSADADTSRGWLHACSRTSPARQAKRQPEAAQRTFISNHQKTFDLCDHPDPLELHGLLMSRNPSVDAELSPIWALSKTTLNSDVLVVPIEQWVDAPEAYGPYMDRPYCRLLWRGSNTGMHYANKDPWMGWRNSHRVRLVGNASATASEADVGVLPPPTKSGSLAMNLQHAPRRTVNRRYMNVAFVGNPSQCEWEDGTCDQLAKEYVFEKNNMLTSEEPQQKYIMDVDGNAWSARMKRLVSSGAVVFKSTIMPEWWNQRAQAWVHYVPVKVDYSDMYDSMAFFAGDLNGEGGVEYLAEQIANAGLDWSRKYWRRVDMAAYMARLYLEWARLLHDGRAVGEADFVYTGEDM